MSSKAMTASRSLLPRWLQSLPAKEAIARLSVPAALAARAGAKMCGKVMS